MFELYSWTLSPNLAYRRVSNDFSDLLRQTREISAIDSREKFVIIRRHDMVKLAWSRNI